MSANSWSKYEFRTLLPHRHIPKVCQILGVTADYFYGAKSDGHLIARPDEPKRIAPQQLPMIEPRAKEK